MGMIRTFGLLFFLTVLVGGCIMANNPSPQVDLTDLEAVEVTWETALGYLQTGEVRAFTQTDQILILVLRDGSIVTAAPPGDELFDEEMVRCGSNCDAVYQISY